MTAEMEDSGWFGMPAGEPVKGQTYRADGWVYRDLPRMTPEYFDQLIDLVGESNIVWLTKADYGDSRRGQLLISPEGMRNIAAYNRGPQ